MVLQVLGKGHFQTYPRLDTNDSADRFMATIQAPDSVRAVYVQHLAVLVSV